MTKFKFNIGDIVTHKATLEERDGSPPKMFIIGRLFEECEGGIQKAYLVRMFKKDTILQRTAALTNDPVRLFEIELAPYPPTTPQGATVQGGK